MSTLKMIKSGIMPSGNKKGTDFERMCYYRKIYDRSGNEKARQLMNYYLNRYKRTL